MKDVYEQIMEATERFNRGWIGKIKIIDTLRKHYQKRKKFPNKVDINFPQDYPTVIFWRPMKDHKSSIKCPCCGEKATFFTSSEVSGILIACEKCEYREYQKEIKESTKS